MTTLYVLIYLLVGLVSGVICLRTLYKTDSPDYRTVMAMWHLLGWPILIGMAVFLGALALIYNVCKVMEKFAQKGDQS